MEGVRVLMKRMEGVEEKRVAAAEPSREQQEALEKLMEQQQQLQEQQLPNAEATVASSPAIDAPAIPVAQPGLQLPETWEERKQRIAKTSPLSSDPRWDIVSFIVKYGDDCRCV